MSRRTSVAAARRARVLWVVCLLWGCEDPAPAPAPSPVPAPSPPPSPQSTERTEEPTTPLSDPSPAFGPSEASAPDAPAEGCAFADPVVAWPQPSWFDIASADGGFFVGGTAARGGNEDAFVARVTADGHAIVVRRRLENGLTDAHRRAPPALVGSESRALLAFVDGRGQLLAARLDLHDASALTLEVVAPSASLRFAPAVHRASDRWWIAWATESDSQRQVLARSITDAGAMSETQDLTPSTGGAAAPTFITGARPPQLLFLDPREATSVTYVATLGASGFSTPEVARPLSLVVDPPQLASVRLGARNHVAYTGLGSAATTAIGWVPLEGTTAPSPIVRGTGYGILHVDLAPFGQGAIVAADAPRASAPTSPREVVVYPIGSDAALGRMHTLSGQSESAARARVAAMGDTIAIGFVSPVGTHVAIGRCVPPT